MLVTDGPYAFVRRPIYYSGPPLMLSGSALAWGSLLTLLLALRFDLTLFFHMVCEELRFERHFGQAWRDDRRRVPRLAPFMRTGGAP